MRSTLTSLRHAAEKATPAVVCACLLLCLAAARAPAAAAGGSEQVDLTVEERLRQQLRKLEWRGVTQLLRWEQRVDKVQKARANTSSNPQELALLSDDEDAGVRFYVAANRYTPLGTRLALSGDPEATVRAGVAMSLEYDPVSPADARSLVEGMAVDLAVDPNVLVRLTLVENGRLPAAAFDTLAADPDYVIRRRLAEGRYTPGRVLERLSRDSIDTVQLTALLHPNVPVGRIQELSASADPMVRMAVCRNVNTPTTVLDSLAGDPLVLVRRLVAAHANTQLATLRRLAADPDSGVLMAVANHPRADRALLTALAYDDRDGNVRLAAQRRLEPLLRNEIREDILERYDAN
ncbi:MAG: hypothetical protein ABIL09_24425 [Gemmatimonadota bacterium]